MLPTYTSDAYTYGSRVQQSQQQAATSPSQPATPQQNYAVYTPVHSSITISEQASPVYSHHQQQQQASNHHYQQQQQHAYHQHQQQQQQLMHQQQQASLFSNVQPRLNAQYQNLQHLPIQTAPQKKPRQTKPLYRLSIGLLKTYNIINNIYYEKQKQRQQILPPVSTTGAFADFNFPPMPQQSSPAATTSYPATPNYSTHLPPSFPSTVSMVPQTLPPSQQQLLPPPPSSSNYNLHQHPPPLPPIPNVAPQQQQQQQQHMYYPPMPQQQQLPMLPKVSTVNTTAVPTAGLQPPQGSHNDGYDDGEGNYTVQIGEELEMRYIVQEVLGRGSFGVVCKCVDIQTQEIVAVKIIKNRYQFYQQAKVEIEILKTLNEKDVDSSYNIVQLKNFFTWRKHLCLVFELLSYNLYDLLKYTKFKGVSLNLIRKFAQQLLGTLAFLSRQDVRVIHCDLKPENILLKNHKKSAIKVIDFGSSCFAHRKMHKYIQSRFYRSPEVILGNSYSCSIDMWSLGCILLEMHIGVPVFDGKDELDQLRKIAAILGMPPFKLIQASSKKAKFFVYDATSQSFKFKLPPNAPPVPQRTFTELLGTNRGGPNGRRINEPNHAPHDYAVFLDLVQRMLQYDPAHRILPHQALNHDFFTKYMQATVPPLPESPLVHQPMQVFPTSTVPNPTLLASHLSTTTVSLAQVYQQHPSSIGIGTQPNPAVLPSPLLPNMHPASVVTNSTSSTNVYIHPNPFVLNQTQQQAMPPSWPGYPPYTGSHK